MAEFTSPAPGRGVAMTSTPASFVATPSSGMRVETRRLAASKTEYSDVASQFIFSIYSTTLAIQPVPVKVVVRERWIEFTKDCTDLYSGAFKEANAGQVFDEVMESAEAGAKGADYAQFVQCISCLARHRFPSMEPAVAMSHLLAHHVFSVDWSKIRETRGTPAAAIHSASFVGASPSFSASAHTYSARSASSLRTRLFAATPGTGTGAGTTITLDRTVIAAASGEAVSSPAVGAAPVPEPVMVNGDGAGNANANANANATAGAGVGVGAGTGSGSLTTTETDLTTGFKASRSDPDADDGDDDGGAAGGGCCWWCCWLLLLLPLLLLLHWLGLLTFHVLSGDREPDFAAFSDQAAFMLRGITNLNFLQACGFNVYDMAAAGAGAGGGGGVIVSPTKVFDSLCYNQCEKLPA